jgi:hypothetical protein
MRRAKAQFSMMQANEQTRAYEFPPEKIAAAKLAIARIARRNCADGNAARIIVDDISAMLGIGDTDDG